MTFLNRAELAAKLEISEARVQQLVAAGAIHRRKGGFDLTESALAFAKWLRRNEESQRAKIRLINAQAAGHERRVRQSLKQLLTVGEVRELLYRWFDNYVVGNQAESSRIYHELALEQGENFARQYAHQILDSSRALALCYRDGITAACKAITEGLRADDERLDEIVDDLMRSARDDDEEVETDESASQPTKEDRHVQTPKTDHRKPQGEGRKARSERKAAK